MTPAELVIERFGSARALARAIGRDPTSVSRWPKTKEEKGLEGRIPSTVQGRILRAAKDLGIELTASEMIWFE